MKAYRETREDCDICIISPRKFHRPIHYQRCIYEISQRPFDVFSSVPVVERDCRIWDLAEASRLLPETD